MSTDTPYAWGRNPPWDDPEEDAFDDAIESTALALLEDIEILIREKIEDNVRDYLEVPDKWYDNIIDNMDTFKEQVATEVLMRIKIK